MSATRILLVDDHVLVRAGIRALVEAIDGMRIVGEASNGREAVALAKEHAPDLVIMDVSMKELNGIDATEAILANAPATRGPSLRSVTTVHSMCTAMPLWMPWSWSVRIISSPVRSPTCARRG